MTHNDLLDQEGADLRICHARLWQNRVSHLLQVPNSGLVFPELVRAVNQGSSTGVIRPIGHERAPLTSPTQPMQIPQPYVGDAL